MTYAGFIEYGNGIAGGNGRVIKPCPRRDPDVRYCRSL